MRIWEFTCYREFLKKEFEQRKEKQKVFSYQYAASKMGVSKSYLKLVISKERHISIDKVPSIKELFGWDDFETQFFLILFLHNSSKDEWIKSYFLGVLRILTAKATVEKNVKTEISPVETDSLFQSWLPMTIHSLSKKKDFIDDPKWIQEKLRDKDVPLDLIKENLEHLIDTKSIVKEDGTWKPANFVNRKPELFDLNEFKVYQTGQLKASWVVEEIKKYTPAHFHMLSLCLDSQKEKELFELFVEFREKLISLSKSSPEGETVFMVSNNVFTLAE